MEYPWCLHLHVWGSGILCKWECYTGTVFATMILQSMSLILVFSVQFRKHVTFSFFPNDLYFPTRQTFRESAQRQIVYLALLINEVRPGGQIYRFHSVVIESSRKLYRFIMDCSHWAKATFFFHRFYKLTPIKFLKKFGRHQSFLWGHSHSCFGILVTSALSFEPRGYSSHGPRG